MTPPDAHALLRADRERHVIKPKIDRLHPMHAAIGDFDNVERAIGAILRVVDR